MRGGTFSGRPVRFTRFAAAHGAVLVLLLAVACGGEARSGQPPIGELRQTIHEHADFAIVIRGQQLDFSDPKFISTADKELSENAHIHEPRYTVVHVHREGTTWDEFLRSLGYELTDVTFGVQAAKTCLKTPEGDKLCNTETETFKFVANGVRVDGIASENIGGLSRLLISYGSETDGEVMAQYALVTDQACIPSGLCEARGSGAGEHGEPCSRAGGQCN